MEQENLTEQAVQETKNYQEAKSFDDILENKEYQSEFDKRVQKAIATAKTKWAKEQLEIKDGKDNEAIAELKEQIQLLNQTIVERDKKEEEKKQEALLDEKVLTALKDKQFVNEYTKNAIVNEIKASLRKDNSIKIDDVLNELVKDKEGIFVNPNAPEIPKVNEDVFTKVDKEAFNKMGYKERLMLKKENPELYEELVK